MFRSLPAWLQSLRWHGLAVVAACVLSGTTGCGSSSPTSPKQPASTESATTQTETTRAREPQAPLLLVTRNTPAAVTLTVDDYYREVHRWPAAERGPHSPYASKYHNRVVQLTGTVTYVSTGNPRFRTVSLAGSEGSLIHCELQHPRPWDVFGLGQQVTVRGLAEVSAWSLKLREALIIRVDGDYPVRLSAPELARDSSEIPPGTPLIVYGEVTGQRYDSFDILTLKTSGEKKIDCYFWGRGYPKLRGEPGELVTLSGYLAETEDPETIELNSCFLLSSEPRESLPPGREEQSLPRPPETAQLAVQRTPAAASHPEKSTPPASHSPADTPPGPGLPFRWKFQPGAQFDWGFTLHMLFEVPQAGQLQQVETNISLDFDFQVREAEAETAVLDMTVTRVRASGRLPGTEFDFDSRDDALPDGDSAPDEENPASQAIAETYGQLLQVKLAAHVNPRGKIERIEYDPATEQLMERFSSLPALRTVVSFLNPTGLNSMYVGGLVPFPHKDITRRTTWTETFDSAASPGGRAFVLKFTPRYAGPVPDEAPPLEQFDVAVNMSFENQPLKLFETGLQKSSGSLLFNREAGHLHSSRWEVGSELIFAGGEATGRMVLGGTSTFTPRSDEPDDKDLR